jgi:hypothetical protein
MADQMSSQEKSFTDEINRLKDLLEKEQKAFKLKAHECTRIIDLNAAFKK